MAKKIMAQAKTKLNLEFEDPAELEAREEAIKQSQQQLDDVDLEFSTTHDLMAITEGETGGMNAPAVDEKGIDKYATSAGIELPEEMQIAFQQMRNAEAKEAQPPPNVQNLAEKRQQKLDQVSAKTEQAPPPKVQSKPPPQKSGSGSIPIIPLKKATATPAVRPAATLAPRPPPAVQPQTKIAPPPPTIAPKVALQAQQPAVTEGTSPQIRKIKLESEIKVAAAEMKGDANAFFISEAKLLEFKINHILQKVIAKFPDAQPYTSQIQKILEENSKKKY